MNDKEIIKRIINRVSEDLQIGTINIEYEAIGKRFQTESNAAETSALSKIIYINSDWVKNHTQNIDQTELKAILYHEVRHLYQMSEINKFELGEKTKESSEIIKKWRDNFSNYIRNINENIDYYKQPVEIDAIAYAFYLMNIDAQTDKDLSLSTTSIPDEIDNDVHNRIQEIHKSRLKSKVIRNEEKAGRNDPCPCGSGKKYKKCCLNKNVF